MGRTRNIRLTPSQDNRLEEIARREGLSVSALIRQSLIRAFSLPTDVTSAHEMVERTDTAGVTEASA